LKLFTRDAGHRQRASGNPEVVRDGENGLLSGIPTWTHWSRAAPGNSRAIRRSVWHPERCAAGSFLLARLVEQTITRFQR